MRKIPTITKNLLIINVLAFVTMLVLKSTSGIDLNDVLGLHFFMASEFEPYQLITYMFMHANFMHILFNMFAVWMFGGLIERALGQKRFLIYFLVCGVGAGVIQEVVQYFSVYYSITPRDILTFSNSFEVMKSLSTQLNGLTTVGASGAVFGILLAFGMMFPDERLFIFPIPIPLKAKWLVIGYAVIELALGVGSPGDSVAHFAHLGGMLFGFLLLRYWRKKVRKSGYYNDSRARSSFYSNMKNRTEQYTQRKKDTTMHATTVETKTDWDYNAKKKAEQAEVDRILDKIRRSGYDSLNADEKQTLFDQKQ